jgi:hypothetical protein
MPNRRQAGPLHTIIMPDHFKISCLTFLMVTLILWSCRNTLNDQTIFQADSIKIFTNHYGDTIIKRYERLDNKNGLNDSDTFIYSIQNIDSSITRSSFYFTGVNSKIYFDINRVIKYCDSQLVLVTPYNDSDLTKWSVADNWKALKRTAESGKKMEGYRDNWLSNLLARFNPLVINDSSHKIPSFLLTEKLLSKTRRTTKYLTIDNRGDTSLIWYWPDFIAIKVEDIDH